MIFAALNEAAQRGELILTSCGMCRWHKRKDGVVVIREILVLPTDRLKGIGRRMIEEVQQLNPGCRITARCPQDYESNGFWERPGFSLEPSGKEGINEWLLLP